MSWLWIAVTITTLAGTGDRVETKVMIGGVMERAACETWRNAEIPQPILHPSGRVVLSEIRACTPVTRDEVLGWLAGSGNVEPLGAGVVGGFDDAAKNE